jgi:hypothetical protein
MIKKISTLFLSVLIFLSFFYIFEANKTIFSMKRLIVFFSLLFSFVFVSSQDKVKKGFGFGALPAVSYDSDLGFQYGALVNLYHYGDGSRYPKYDHSLYMELSTFTKGRVIARMRYDSEKLIPKETYS